MRKRRDCRDLRENALEHRVDINLEKNFFKSFSTVGFCSHRLENWRMFKIDNNEKWNTFFLTVIIIFFSETSVLGRFLAIFRVQLNTERKISENIPLITYIQQVHFSQSSTKIFVIIFR